jgi:hypothetical protein
VKEDQTIPDNPIKAATANIHSGFARVKYPMAAVAPVMAKAAQL